jgi:hypothetical protein
VEAAIPWRQRAYLGADGANLLIMHRRGQDRERLRTWQHRPASQTLRTYNRLGIEERYRVVEVVSQSRRDIRVESLV